MIAIHMVAINILRTCIIACIRQHYLVSPGCWFSLKSLLPERICFICLCKVFCARYYSFIMDWFCPANIEKATFHFVKPKPTT